MKEDKFTERQLEQIKKNRDYWGRRIEEFTHHIQSVTEDEALRLLKKEYKRSFSKIKDLVEGLYFELLESGGLSTTKLYQYGRFKNLSNAFNRELERLGKKETEIVKDTLEKAYLKQIGVAVKEFGTVNFALPNKKAIEKVVMMQWSGRDFSSSIWQNKTKLLNNLEKVVRDCISLGYNKDKAIKYLMSTERQSFGNTEKLVRTELMHILNSANDEVAKDVGYKFKSVLSAKDERVCPICRGLDGEVFPINAADVLPAHPRCRCCFIYMKDYKG